MSLNKKDFLDRIIENDIKHCEDTNKVELNKFERELFENGWLRGFAKGLMFERERKNVL